jgi:hypothetical protein
MIRVFTGNRTTFKDWETIAEVFREGLRSVCENDCDRCAYNYACKEISQAITYCDKQANKKLAKEC